MPEKSADDAPVLVRRVNLNHEVFAIPELISSFAFGEVVQIPMLPFELTRKNVVPPQMLLARKFAFESQIMSKYPVFSNTKPAPAVHATSHAAFHPEFVFTTCIVGVLFPIP